MKWIAVILVMLNLVVFLLMKAYPTANQAVSDQEFDAVNESAMHVIVPDRTVAKVSERASGKAFAGNDKADSAAANAPQVKSLQAKAGNELQEDSLAQLKVDNTGKVLMARRDENQDSTEKNVAESKVPPATADNTNTPALQPLDRRQPEAAPVKAPDQAVAKALPEPDPAPIRKPEPAAVAAPAAAVPAVVEAVACYRIGPFTSQNELTEVRHKLDSQTVSYRVEEKTAPGKIKAVRVYLGAFASQAALNKEKARLTSMKIENFVIRLNGEQLIQLGYFSEPKRAKAYQKKLVARGVKAKTSTIYRETRIESWLNLDSAPPKLIDGLGIPANARKQKRACP